MAQSCFLVVDSGTSRMKAALIDESNRLIDLAAADLRVLRPFDGASEADLDETWDVLVRLFQQLAQKHPRHWEKVIGIGITGQGDGAWMLDQDGCPARSAILWNDTRTKRTAVEDLPALTHYCQEHAISPIFPGANYYILKWVKENQPEIYKRIRTVFHCKDWLNYRITGNLATDYSDTSTSLLDAQEMDYDFQVLDYLGIAETRNLFPPLRYSDEITGFVTPDASRITGLRAGIPVAAGAIDIASVAAGAGVLEPGDTIAIVGTTCCVTMVLDKTQLDYRNIQGSTLVHLARQRYLRLMAMSNGTASLDWVRNGLMPDTPFAVLEAALGNIPVGSEGVMFQPYLYGERAPFRDPCACGSFLGVTARHTPEHLVRAAYEGLALALSECYEALPKSDRPIYISGGGSASSVFIQMVSDCLGKTLLRPAVSELGLYGILGAVRNALGLSSPSIQQDSPENVFEPDPDRHARYDELARLFAMARQSLSPWWQERDRYLKNSND